MADPQMKLPPGAELVPGQSVAQSMKLPPGAQLLPQPSAPVSGSGAGSSDTSIPGEFMNTASEHLANFLPNMGSTIAGLATHPLDTGMQMVRNLINTPKDLYTDATTGHVGRALENATELAAPTLIGKGMGRLLESGAAPTAEIAGRVTKYDRGFGANPGRAVIRETSAPTIGGTARQLGEKETQLSNQLMGAARDASERGVKGDLLPARAAVEGPLENARQAGATSTVRQLDQMKSYLQGEAPEGFGGKTIPGERGPGTPAVTSSVLDSWGRPVVLNPAAPGLPGPPRISPFQTPEQLVRMRQEFPTNFRVNYGPNVDSRIEDVGRQVNHALSDEVKRTVPGASDLDSRVQDLIAARRPFESTSQNAGLGQRLASRMMAHTGALAGAGIGYATHGLPGAIAGFTLPELITSPTVQLNAARALDAGGRALQNPRLTLPLTVAWRASQGPQQSQQPQQQQ